MTDQELRVRALDAIEEYRRSNKLPEGEGIWAEIERLGDEYQLEIDYYQEYLHVLEDMEHDRRMRDD